jgi:hypothetical protein
VATHYDYSVNVTDSSMATTKLESFCAPIRVTVNPPLSAGISPGNSTVAAGQPVELFATPSEGTFPYTYQWYTGHGCVAKNVIPGQVAYVYTAKPRVTATYSVQVADSPRGASPTSVCSAATVTVNPTLTLVGGGLHLNPQGIDINQTATIAANVTWAGGTSPYSVELYSGVSSSCSLDTTTVSVLSGTNPRTIESQNVTSTVFTFASPSSNTEYCASVTAGTGPFKALFSVVRDFMLNSPPTASISYSPPSPIASGSSVILTAIPSQGISPYSYRWYAGPNCSNDVLDKSQIYTGQVWINQPSYSVLVRDSSIGVPASSHCAKVSMNVITTGPIPTEVGVSCSPLSVVVGSRPRCTALVSGIGSPTGYVTWSSNSSGTFSSPSCRLRSGVCSVWFRPNAAGSVVLTANYGGDSNHAPSAGTNSLTAKQHASRTYVRCTPTSIAASSTKTITCTATVRGYSPTGNVTWSWSGTGALSSPPVETCALAGRLTSSCSVTFGGASSGTVTVNATYSGDTNNKGSLGYSGKLKIT